MCVEADGSTAAAAGVAAAAAAAGAPHELAPLLGSGWCWCWCPCRYTPSCRWLSCRCREIDTSSGCGGQLTARAPWPLLCPNRTAAAATSATGAKRGCGHVYSTGQMSLKQRQSALKRRLAACEHGGVWNWGSPCGSTDTAPGDGGGPAAEAAPAKRNGAAAAKVEPGAAVDDTTAAAALMMRLHRLGGSCWPCGAPGRRGPDKRSLLLSPASPRRCNTSPQRTRATPACAQGSERWGHHSMEPALFQAWQSAFAWLSTRALPRLLMLLCQSCSTCSPTSPSCQKPLELAPSRFSTASSRCPEAAVKGLVPGSSRAARVKGFCGPAAAQSCSSQLIKVKTEIDESG